MVKRPSRRISPADLESLTETLDVRFVALAECLVSPGYRLTIGGNRAPGIHYNLVGSGRIYICDNPSIELHPHTLRWSALLSVVTVFGSVTLLVIIGVRQGRQRHVVTEQARLSLLRRWATA